MSDVFPTTPDDERDPREDQKEDKKREEEIKGDKPPLHAFRSFSVPCRFCNRICFIETRSFKDNSDGRIHLTNFTLAFRAFGKWGF